MFLRHLLKWAPFKIDALGSITLLGADEVNRATGTLAINRVAEFLPLMCGHVIAGDSIRKPIPGFTLYNITDGICASDVSSWFSRWLQSQNVTYNRTTFIIEFAGQASNKERSLPWKISLGILYNVILITFSITLSDWWGFANSSALASAVILRTAMLRSLRKALDSSAEIGLHQSQELVKTL